MKNVIKNFRYYVLALLWAVAIIGVMSAPEESLPFFTWVWVLFSTKVVGFGAGYIAFRLTERWDAAGTIPEYTKFVDEL